MAFNVTFFYIFNSTTLPDYTLSAGQNRDSNGTIDMTRNAYSSSENWQIFPQGGRYFIRNFDYGSAYQLGLSKDDQKIPRLYPQSGSIAQQWSILEVQDGYQFVNGLLGNTTSLDLQGSSVVPPVMQASEAGRTWIIVRNPSAEKSTSAPRGSDMYSEVQGFELSSSGTVAASSSEPSAPSTLSTPTSGSNSSANSPSSSSPNSSSLSMGAIVGIVIGGIAFLVLLILSVWSSSHKRKATKQEPYELNAQDLLPGEKYTHRAELDTLEPARAAHTARNRVELP